MKRAPRKERENCSACGAPIKWAHFSDGVRPIEKCPEGEGTVAIQAPLPGIDGKTFAIQVSGVLTTWRLHLDTCPHAEVFRSRWRTRINCRGCGVRMLALENGRTVCARCQRKEATKVDELAGLLVERFGHHEAHAQLTQAIRRTPAPTLPELPPHGKAYSYQPRRKRRPTED